MGLGLALRPGHFKENSLVSTACPCVYMMFQIVISQNGGTARSSNAAMYARQ